MIPDAEFHEVNFIPEQPWFVLNSCSNYVFAFSKNPAISHYYTFTTQNEVVHSLAIPDGCIDILFDCTPDSPSTIICGTTLQATSVSFGKNRKYFGVRFKAGLVPKFIDAHAFDLISNQVDLKDVFIKGNDICDLISKKNNIFEQVHVIESYFEGFEMKSISNLSKTLLAIIKDGGGNLKVKNLSDLTGFTPRTLQRQFLQDIGLPPKLFCRILRIQSAIDLIITNKNLCFTDVALTLGFSDQSHFLREFKKSVNSTPSGFKSLNFSEKLFHVSC